MIPTSGAKRLIAEEASDIAHKIYDNIQLASKDYNPYNP
jgi:hypothetical protein